MPGPFVALNVAAIQEGLFESELFGHAFTGAAAARRGAFREATAGVLRALESAVVRPLGSRADVASLVQRLRSSSLPSLAEDSPAAPNSGKAARQPLPSRAAFVCRPEPRIAPNG